jgi:hypothetical protein
MQVGSISSAVSTDARASPVAYSPPPPARRSYSPTAKGRYQGVGSAVAMDATAASTPTKGAWHSSTLAGSHLGTPTWGEEPLLVRTPDYRAASVTTRMSMTSTATASPSCLTLSPGHVTPTSPATASPSRLTLSPGQVIALSRSGTLTGRQSAAASRRVAPSGGAPRVREPLARDVLHSLQRQVSFLPNQSNESGLSFSAPLMTFAASDRSGGYASAATGTGTTQPSISHASSGGGTARPSLPRPPAPADGPASFGPAPSLPSFSAMMSHGRADQHAAKPWAHTRESTARWVAGGGRGGEPRVQRS